MNTTFRNSKNSRAADPHRLFLDLADKTNLKRSDKYVAFSNISIYCQWKNIKKSYKDNKFKISAPTWNEEFQLLDRSNSILDMQDFFECIFKKLEKRLIILQ